MRPSKRRRIPVTINHFGLIIPLREPSQSPQLAPRLPISNFPTSGPGFGLFYLLDLEPDLLSSRLLLRRRLGSSLCGLRGCLCLSAERCGGGAGTSWKGAYLVSLSLSSSYIISSRVRVGLVLARRCTRGTLTTLFPRLLSLLSSVEAVASLSSSESVSEVRDDWPESGVERYSCAEGGLLSRLDPLLRLSDLDLSSSSRMYVGRLTGAVAALVSTGTAEFGVRILEDLWTRARFEVGHRDRGGDDVEYSKGSISSPPGCQRGGSGRCGTSVPAQSFSRREGDLRECLLLRELLWPRSSSSPAIRQLSASLGNSSTFPVWPW